MRRLNMARSRRSAFVVAIVLVALLCAHGASADTAFGRNKVQYRSFDWRIIHTEHFDVYFYEGGEDIADAASQIIEDANADFEVLLGHELTAIIPIILYNSHNEFQQTNVSLSHVEETVGGFTELFKNRVVIPFTGSYDDLRHVLYHELTHVFMFDIVYGGLVESVIRQAYTNPVPLWFVEGLAEYTSMWWDPEAEMILRDLTVSYGGYLVYKGGQSVLNFIAERYGREKIAEIVKAIAKTHNLDAALRETIGLMTPELSEEWHEWLQEKYWPEVTERDDGDRLATFVTDHREDDSYFNFGPAISPDGKKVVFVSDRNRTANVFVSSTLDGRTLHHVVSGEVTDEFEALHILRTGFAWSPDASQICFATKAGRSDALHFADAESGDIVASHRYDLDGIFTPSWSPDGRSIVFVGLKNGASDLYLTDVDGAEPRQLTDDFFDERDPEWSPDGSKVAFSSDRDSPPEMGFRRDYDIYSMDIETLEVTRLVATPGRDGSPAWAHHGELMAYGSDMHGSPAIYMADLETGLSVLATDLLGGAKAPSWAREADWAAFQLYSEGGWDIAVVKNPLSRFEEVIDENGWFPSIKQEVPDEPTRPDVEVIAEADFIGPSPAPAGAAAVGAAAVAVAEGPPLGGNPSGHAGAGNGNGNGNGKLFAGQTAAEERNGGASEGTGEPERVYGGEGPHEDPDALDGDRFESGGEATSDASDESAPGSSEQYADGSDYDDDRDDAAVAKAREAYAKASGVHTPGADMEDEPRDLGKIEPYRPRFAPDYVTGGLAYTSSFGFSAGAEIAISDVLGNHRFYIAADLFTSIEASNLYVRYENLSHRFNYSIGLYNFTENYYSDRTQLGEYLGKRRYFTERSFGATASLEYPFSKFTRIEFDLAAMSIDRKYLAENDEGYIEPTEEQERRQLLIPSVRLVNDTTLWGSVGPVGGGRYSISLSKGWDPDGSFDYLSAVGDIRKYVRIGPEHTLALKFLGARSSSQSAQYFYMGGVNGLRGFGDFQFRGHNLILTSIELRFPLLRRLEIGSPLPLALWNVRGVVFLDAGAAWEEKFRGVSSGALGRRLDDIMAAYGFGARINLGYFVLRFDWAWPSNGRTSGPMRMHFAMGAEF